jgi:DNA-binding MarR family transcriptional regulator
VFNAYFRPFKTGNFTMIPDSTMDQAWHIFNTGRMIHDRIFQVKTSYFSGKKEKNTFEDLSIAQLNAVMLIRTRKQVSITGLSKLLRVSPPSASAMVDRLVEKRILSREQSPKDRRRVVVTISSGAMHHIEQVEKAIFQSFVGLVEKLEPETTLEWCAVLEKVKAVLAEEINTI